MQEAGTTSAPAAHGALTAGVVACCAGAAATYEWISTMSPVTHRVATANVAAMANPSADRGVEGSGFGVIVVCVRFAPRGRLVTRDRLREQAVGARYIERCEPGCDVAHAAAPGAHATDVWIAAACVEAVAVFG